MISVGCYAFKSCQNGKYLRYQSDSGGIIMASGVDVVDPCGRFFVEPPASPKLAGIVAHIRCSYNNKYWVCRKVSDDDDKLCISADAHEPVDDTSKDSTLFMVRRFARQYMADKYDFLDPHGESFMAAGENHPLSNALLLEPSKAGGNTISYFVAIDLENQVVLPPRVCFRGGNGMYLCVPSNDESDSYVQFKPIDDNDYSSAMHTISTYEDGTIRIESEAATKYWRRGTVREEGWIHAWDGIWVDSEGSNRRDPDISFQALKHRDRIALKNVGNNRYCKRLTIIFDDDSDTGEQLNILGAKQADNAITDGALLELAGEPLQSRVIYDLEYHLDDARVYDKKTVELEGKSDGGTGQKFELTQQSTWTTTVTVKEAVTTVIKGKVPFLDSEGKLQLGKHDITETIVWGESITHTLPKWASTTTRTEATQCTYEVPYSYTQEDTFTDGKKYHQVYYDGLYRGVSCYNIHLV